MLAPIDIARLEEARIARGVAELVAVAEPWAGGVLCYEEPGCWANEAQAALCGPVSDDQLDRLVEFYVSRGVEPKIEMCPFVDESLVAGLAARGFTLKQFENVLYRELAPDEDLRGALPHGWPAGLTLERVEPGDRAAEDLFIDVATSGFRAPGEPVADSLARTVRRVIEHPRNDCYLALLEGEAVGGTGMETAGEIACLFGTSVLEPARRRGIQQAMIVRRLERARERGARVVTIHSKPGIPTERNAARLGFAMAYTRAVMVMKGEGLVASM